MKHLPLLLILLSGLAYMVSCGGEDPCESVVCVNGDCLNGKCECDEGWTGEKCDQQKEPRSITVNKIVIKKFVDTDNGKPWDDEDDDSKADISVRVTDLTNNYFTPTDIVNQVHENASSGNNYEVNTNFKVRNYTDDIRFELVDYDVDDNFNVDWEFIGSVKMIFQENWANWPESYSIKSSSGKTEIEVFVKYNH